MRPNPGRPRQGLAAGWLVAAGGGHLEGGVVDRFLELAGHPDAKIVFIPTAADGEDFPADWEGLEQFRRPGGDRFTILHTRDRNVADSRRFTKPLRQATGVWFGGGRQWRLIDAYLNTATHRELRALLARGGVIGGNSAGATILGSYLTRGAKEGNHILMAPGYEEGLGFLANAVIDQHLLQREREYDLVDVVGRHPELLGIGLDEGTAIVVHRNRFDVIGRGNVAIYDIGYIRAATEAPFYFLSVGNAFDLGARRPEKTP